MPAAIKEINLLPKDKLSSGLWGKAISWALTVGRYIVITTELVVVVAFLFRFRYDMQLAQIREEVRDNQQIIGSYQDLEKKFRHLQSRTNTVKEIETKNLTPTQTHALLSQVVPSEVFFLSMDIDKKNVEIKGISLSDAGLVTMINNIQSNPSFTALSLDSLSSGGERDPTLEFSLSMQTK